MWSNRVRRILGLGLLCAFAALLAACGGGSGSESGSNSGSFGGEPQAASTGAIQRFAYVANFDDNTVSVFTVDAATGQ